MPPPFAFLPRAVSNPHTTLPPSSSSVPSLLNREELPAKHSSTTHDIAALISLALSDYNLCLDPVLRRNLDHSLAHADSPDGAGFVPINYLIRRSPFRPSLAATHTDPSETEVVKALRTHASHTLEVRMLLSPSSSVWYGSGKTSRKKDVGGYEVRRRDWPTLLHRPSRAWTRPRWDETTVYMECVPPLYRTIGAIARFAETLLPPPPDPHICVQNVALPPHYLDNPGDTPKCKGYALVTFSTKEHADTILGAWPWRRRPAADDASPAVREALKFGLKTISKARWDQLNEEYLIYKQQLLDEMARTQADPHYPTGCTSPAVATEDERPDPASVVPQTTPSSPYPFNCLVFVRNVHPQTNKTTLKGLFSQAFQGGGVEAHAAGLDYVDFNKGMDTCYLRLASSHHATLLTDHFGERLTAQAHGLDVSGRRPGQDDKLITMEIIQGKKEEVYWQKVPEKVRRQAVDKAVKAQLVPGAELSVSPTTRTPQSNGVRGHEKRKREQ